MVHTATLVLVSLVGMLAGALILLAAQVQIAAATVVSDTVRFDRLAGQMVQCGPANDKPALWWGGAGQDCADQ